MWPAANQTARWAHWYVKLSAQARGVKHASYVDKARAFASSKSYGRHGSRAFSIANCWKQEEKGHGTGQQGDEGQMDNTDLAIGVGAIVAAAGFGYFVHSMTSEKSNDRTAVETKALATKTSVEQLIPSSTAKLTQATYKHNLLLGEIPERQQPEPHPKFSMKKGHPLPRKVPYLLVGAGTATFAALRAIRSREPNAKILILGAENCPPYMRPPLSKEFWFEDLDHAVGSKNFKQWNGKQRSAFFEPDDYYMPYEDLMDSPSGGVSLVTGVKVTRIDTEHRKAYLDNGAVVGFSKCLLAPGGKPKTLPVLEQASSVDPEVKRRWMVFRGLDDFEYLVQVMKNVRSIAVVGGGFLGSELACALGKAGSALGVNVCQIFKEEGNLRSVLPGYLSEWSTKKVEECGVNVLPNKEIIDVQATRYEDSSAESQASELLLTLNDGETLPVDFVVTCVGIEPNTDIGHASGLEVDDQFGGFLVNSEFMAKTNLWVAGDASCFYDPLLGRRRVEHHDHAVVSGRLAGENMTGAMKHYKHQSMIWSDLGPEIGFEAVGLVDSRLPTVGIFAKPKESGEAMKAKLDTNMRSESQEGVVSMNGPLVAPGITSLPSSMPWRKGNLHLTSGSPIAAGDAEAKISSNHTDPQKDPEYKKGVVFYTKDERVVGIVLWNIFSRMPLARRVLQEAITTHEIPEVAKMFDIHDKESHGI